MSSDAPPEPAAAQQQQQSAPKPPAPAQAKATQPTRQEKKPAASEPGAKTSEKRDTKPQGNRKKNGNQNGQIGTGASLLNRKVRGTKDGGKVWVYYLAPP